MANLALTGILEKMTNELNKGGFKIDVDLEGKLSNIVIQQLDDAAGDVSGLALKWSATVDSHLFSQYFGNCPVVTAQGRTHPVSTQFLEDIHEKLNYRLASDSPAFIDNGIWLQKRAPVGDKRGKKILVLSGWGDEALLSEELINPYYNGSDYLNYSEQTRQNLKKLNEDTIDYDLLEDLVCHIDETYAEGAILVFLPGVAEINMLLDRLSAVRRFGGNSNEWLLPLHSSIAPEDQRKVFLNPPENIRKVIVATNIAETSITIDDIVYVIDCGKHKENRYNPNKLKMMRKSWSCEDWISQANARQRRGRAGRVKPGICFCLYTRQRYEKLMRPYQIPEMLRTPLTELCLQVKLLFLGPIPINQFLSKALEPPREESITSAVSLLYEVGAIEGNEELTPLGYHLARLPVDVLIGKMILYGGIFGCLSSILTISAFLSYKSPFVYPKDERESVERAKLALLANQNGDGHDVFDCVRQSDQLLMMVAYEKWDRILSLGMSTEIKCECLDILYDVLHKYGNLMASDHEILLTSLLPQLNTYQASVRKKAVSCIASLASSLSDDLMAKPTVEIQAMKSEITRTNIQMIWALSRAVGYRFGPHLGDAVPILINYCNNAPENDEELLEYSLQALESFLLRCTRDISSYCDQILHLTLEFKSHDLNDDESYVEEEDDANEYTDDEDVSWKVRRAAAKCLWPEMLSRLYKEGVRDCAISCMGHVTTGGSSSSSSTKTSDSPAKFTGAGTLATGSGGGRTDSGDKTGRRDSGNDGDRDSGNDGDRINQIGGLNQNGFNLEVQAQWTQLAVHRYKHLKDKTCKWNKCHGETWTIHHLCVIEGRRTKNKKRFEPSQITKEMESKLSEIWPAIHLCFHGRITQLGEEQNKRFWKYNFTKHGEQTEFTTSRFFLECIRLHGIVKGWNMPTNKKLTIKEFCDNLPEKCELSLRRLSSLDVIQKRNEQNEDKRVDDNIWIVDSARFKINQNLVFGATIMSVIDIDSREAIDVNDVTD